MIIFNKFITIVVNYNNIYEIYAFIKFKNQRNYIINKRKFNVFILILINIYEILLNFRNNYIYFLLIVNNHLKKI